MSFTCKWCGKSFSIRRCDNPQCRPEEKKKRLYLSYKLRIKRKEDPEKFRKRGRENYRRQREKIRIMKENYKLLLNKSKTARIFFKEKEKYIKEISLLKNTVESLKKENNKMFRLLQRPKKVKKIVLPKGAKND